jgi:hypothetical protein
MVDCSGRLNKEPIMPKSEYYQLVAIYGEETARAALDWFVREHSEAFRAAVRQAAYCETNEYLWKSQR